MLQTMERALILLENTSPEEHIAILQAEIEERNKRIEEIKQECIDIIEKAKNMDDLTNGDTLRSLQYTANRCIQLYKNKSRYIQSKKILISAMLYHTWDKLPSTRTNNNRDGFIDTIEPYGPDLPDIEAEKIPRSIDELMEYIIKKPSITDNCTIA
jgi:hypothetical protein